jgi:hypothetical protein
MLKINNFTILLENGDRINKKKIEKLDKFMCLDHLNILLLTSESAEKTQDDEVRKILSICDNTNVRNIMTLNSIAKKIENQNKIINFLSNFYKNTINRISTKNIFMLNSIKAFIENKDELEKNMEVFILDLKDLLKNYCLPQDEVNKNTKNIENNFIEFKKNFKIFEEKFDTFNKLFNEFKMKSSKHYETFIQEKFEILYSISKLWAELKSNPKGVILEKDKLLIYQTTLHNLSTNNTNKIKNLIEEDNVNLKREIIGKITELELLRKSVEANMNISLIPKFFKNEIVELENEIRVRKDFDDMFTGIVSFLNNQILTKEETRRKEYILLI